MRKNKKILPHISSNHEHKKLKFFHTIHSNRSQFFSHNSLKSESIFSHNTLKSGSNLWLAWWNTAVLFAKSIVILVLISHATYTYPQLVDLRKELCEKASLPCCCKKYNTSLHCYYSRDFSCNISDILVLLTPLKRT